MGFWRDVGTGMDLFIPRSSIGATNINKFNHRFTFSPKVIAPLRIAGCGINFLAIIGILFYLQDHIKGNQSYTISFVAALATGIIVVPYIEFRILLMTGLMRRKSL